MPSQIPPIDAIHNNAEIEILNRNSAIVLTDDEHKISIPRKTAKAALNDFLEKYPTMERWRLFVDGMKYAKTGPQLCWPMLDPAVAETISKNTHIDKKDLTNIGFTPKGEGWLTYEHHEAGSVTACLYVLDFALRFVNLPRNEVLFTREIHKQLLSHTKIEFATTVIPGDFRKNVSNYFDLSPGRRLTQEGMKDLFEKIADGSLDDAYFDISNHVASSLLIKLLAKYPDRTSEYKNIIYDFARSRKKIVFDKAVFNKIKAVYPNYYDDFLNGISEFLINSTDTKHEYFTYNPVGNKSMRARKSLYPMRWEEIGLHRVNDFKMTTQLDIVLNPHGVFLPEVAERMMSALSPSLLDETKRTIIKNLQQEVCNIEQLPDQLLEKLFFAVLYWKNSVHFNVREMIQYAEVKVIRDGLKPLEVNHLFLEKLDLRLVQVGVRTIISSMVRELYHEKITKAVEMIWENYHQRISRPNLTDDERLKIIGETVQAFERTHPFPDLNGRTFANIILTILLIENGFPPPTFLDPNVFDAHDDIVNILKRAMLNTLEVYKCHDQNKTVDLFGFETKALDNKLEAQIRALKEQLYQIRALKDDQLYKEGADYKKISENIDEKKSLLMRKIVKKADKLYMQNCCSVFFTKSKILVDQFKENPCVKSDANDGMKINKI